MRSGVRTGLILTPALAVPRNSGCGFVFGFFADVFFADGCVFDGCFFFFSCCFVGCCFVGDRAVFCCFRAARSASAAASAAACSARCSDSVGPRLRFRAASTAELRGCDDFIRPVDPRPRPPRLIVDELETDTACPTCPTCLTAFLPLNPPTYIIRRFRRAPVRPSATADPRFLCGY